MLPITFYIALGAWLSGIAVAVILGGRRLPAVILILGAIVLGATFQGILPEPWPMVALAVLSVVIWIGNKAGTGGRT